MIRQWYCMCVCVCVYVYVFEYVVKYAVGTLLQVFFDNGQLNSVRMCVCVYVCGWGGGKVKYAVEMRVHGFFDNG